MGGEAVEMEARKQLQLEINEVQFGSIWEFKKKKEASKLCFLTKLCHFAPPPGAKWQSFV